MNERHGPQVPLEDVSVLSPLLQRSLCVCLSVCLSVSLSLSPHHHGRRVCVCVCVCVFETRESERETESGRERGPESEGGGEWSSQENQSERERERLRERVGVSESGGVGGVEGLDGGGQQHRIVANTDAETRSVLYPSLKRPQCCGHMFHVLATQSYSVAVSAAYIPCTS